MALLLHHLLVVFISLACHATYAAQASLAAPEASGPNAVGADHLALMAFKSHVTSDPLQAMVSWGNQSIPMCQWNGVECGLRGRRHGRVVALDLTDLNLVGTITPALGNLTYLKRLHLYNNRLQGSLPAELGDLQELTDLNLRHNSIEGQIPASLSNCRRIKKIWLYDNNLEGQIPSELALLRDLEVLAVGENRLIGNIPSSITSLVNLQVLITEVNNLTGVIPPDIGSLVNLTVLGLGLQSVLRDHPCLDGKPFSLAISKCLLK
jgi:Leucine-rich repeat (LRR) protein